MKKDWDTPEQCDLFDEYLEKSADINDRVKWNNAYGYAECEWEAFQYGWNAAKQHYSPEKIIRASAAVMDTLNQAYGAQSTETGDFLCRYWGVSRESTNTTAS